MTDRLLSQAREAIQSGIRAKARALLVYSIKQDPNNIEAWLLLAEAVHTKEQAVYCLEHVLKIDPHNYNARKWLSILNPEKYAPPDAGRTPSITRRPPPGPVEASKPEIRGQPLTPGLPVVEDVEPSYQESILTQQTTTAPTLNRPEIVYIPPSRPPEVIPESGPKEDREAHLTTGQIYRLKRELPEEEADLEALRPKKLFNWPLLVGILSLGIIIFLAIAGPSLAPHDPLTENIIIQIDGEWYIPPFEPFTKGFLLGSDMFGRDTLSRILWAVRPTLVMVVIVAFVRLVIGTVIGLLAGWTTGRIARFLDTIIEAAIAIPVLLVALCAIAVIGVEYGLWAFIIGLSINGWVETSQQVREQTRIVKSQAYIEAAHAQGATSWQIITHHVLKQIAPMTVMLFAFEMSSTLMTTAGLGFLGYYIGGDVWVDVEDFVARRISGMPELGQMLATSWQNLTQPWGMVAVGTTVFLAVLGLNLLGEGLRQRLNLLQVRKRGIVARTVEKVRLQFDEYLLHPLSLVFDKPAVRIALSASLLIILVGFTGSRYLWPKVQTYLQETPIEEILLKYTNSQVTENGSSQAIPDQEQASAAATEIINYTPQIMWEFEDEHGFSGGLATSPDGKVLYASSSDGSLHAMNLNGETLWETALITTTVGPPVVGPDGTIYVTDLQAGLTALTPDGNTNWRVISHDGYKALSPPELGPDGTIYYTVSPGGQGFVQSVSSAGEGLWITQANTNQFYRTPDASLDGKYVFLREDIFDAQTGLLLAPKTDLDVMRYFHGEDGYNYLQAGDHVIRWELNGDTIEVIEHAEWNAPRRQLAGNIIMPIDSGVTTDGTAWMIYTSPGGTTEFVWVTMEDQLLGIADFNSSQGQLVDLAEDKTAFVCGGKSFSDEFAKCAALSPGTDTPVWELDLGRVGLVQGGVWLGEHLYLTTLFGKLYAINVIEQVEVVESAPETSPLDVPQESAGNRPKPDQPSVIWTYQIPETIKEFRTYNDGEVYALTVQHNLYVIEPDGTYDSMLTIDPGPFRLINNWGSAGPVLWPKITSSGTIIVISNADLAYGMDSDGNKLWEYELTEEPHSRPPDTDQDVYYFVDTKGALYAFDADGLKWKYQPEEAPYAASELIVGSKGNLYYTITDRGRAYVVAVSPEGEHLWTTQTNTKDLYDPVQITIDERFVFLNDNAIDAATGELLEFDTPVKVDEFIPGMDGRTYLRSGHTVMEWQYGPEGFNLIQTEPWQQDSFNSFNPTGVLVDQNHLIWLFYEGSSPLGYGTQVVWVTLQGEVKSSYFWSRSSQQLVMPDYENSRIIECSYLQVESSLICEAYVPESDTPVWNVTVPDIPAFEGGFIQDEYVYLQTNDDQIIAAYIGSP